MENPSLQKQFLEAYDELSESIFRHCFFRVSNREEALDITQEVFIKTWVYLSKGNDIQDVRAFLYKVANNRIIDHYRKKKTFSLDDILEREENVWEPHDEGLSKDRMLHQAEIAQVLLYIDKLDEPYRQVVIMRYIDGLPPQEIADIVGETPNNVSVRINRGISKLKEIIENNGK